MIDDIVRELDGAILKPAGFTRQRHKWNRRSGEFIDVVAVNLDKGGTLVAIAVGVVDPKTYTLFWRRSLPRTAGEEHCLVSERLAEFADGTRRTWLPADRPDTASAIAGLLRHEGIQFVENMHARKAQEEFLESRFASSRYLPPVAYLALLKAERGDRHGACAVLTAMRERLFGDAWRSHLEETAQYVGCLGTSAGSLAP